MRSDQKKKKLIIAIIGAVIASFTVFSSLNSQIAMINALNSKLNEQNKVISELKQQSPINLLTQNKINNKLIIAKASIKPGTMITQDLLETRELKEGEIIKDSFNDVSFLIGQMVSDEIKAGDPFLKSKIINNQSSEFNIPTGMRAITIPNEYIQGLASYITVGSKIDIISTIKEIDSKPPIIVQNVKIISLETPALGVIQETKANKASAITLEVPAIYVQRLVEGMVKGKLQIVTRGYQDNKIITNNNNPAKLRYNTPSSNIKFELPFPPKNLNPITTENISSLPEPAMPTQKTKTKSVEMIQANVKSEVSFDKD